jgi:hemerythrin
MSFCDHYQNPRPLSELDDDHKRLVKIVHRLFDAAVSESSPSTCAALIGQLFDSTREHFRHEEQVMRENGYPHYATHTREHVGILRSFRPILDHGSGTATVNEDMLSISTELICTHFDTTDLSFATYLANRHIDRALLWRHQR